MFSLVIFFVSFIILSYLYLGPSTFVILYCYSEDISDRYAVLEKIFLLALLGNEQKSNNSQLHC